MLRHRQRAEHEHGGGEKQRRIGFRIQQVQLPSGKLYNDLRMRHDQRVAQRDRQLQQRGGAEAQEKRIKKYRNNRQFTKASQNFVFCGAFSKLNLRLALYNDLGSKENKTIQSYSKNHL